MIFRMAFIELNQNKKKNFEKTTNKTLLWSGRSNRRKNSKKEHLGNRVVSACIITIMWAIKIKANDLQLSPTCWKPQ